MEEKNFKKAEIILSYKELEFLKFMKEHPAINIFQVEKDCELPKDTFRHFINKRRKLPTKYFLILEKYLSNYGYVPLEQ